MIQTQSRCWNIHHYNYQQQQLLVPIYRERHNDGGVYLCCEKVLQFWYPLKKSGKSSDR